MTYAIDFTKSANKEIKKLHPNTAKQVAKAIQRLSTDPRKGDVRLMKGTKSW